MQDEYASDGEIGRKFIVARRNLNLAVAGSVDVDNLNADILTRYAGLCAWTRARSHARSGDPVAIARYRGSSDTFDQALTDFAERYADQNQRDYEAFLKEIQSGRLEAAPESS